MLDPDISTADALRHLQVADADPNALDRRRFLQLVGLGVGAGALAGPASSLLDLSLPGLDPAVWAAGPAGPNDGVLIVIGMFGGNDGLNTVVPINDQLYYGQHRSLAIRPENTLAIDASTGLNSELTVFKQFWDAGQLAIVEGVGYPDPDLSHFNSMAKWMAGSPTGIPTSGWLGRWLDGYLGNTKNLYAAAQIGQSVPLHLIGRNQRGTAVPAGRPAFGASANANDRNIYAALRRLGAGDPATWRGRVGGAMVDQLDLATTLAPLIPPDDQLSDVPLVAEMEVMARLVNANLGLRVLSAGWGDFDSHAGQPNQHGTRMRELNAAVQRFFQVLSPAWSSRVTIMTFSEFGRTSWSNDGAGTDHGTSAPHFVLGANVRGGRYGQRPSLAGLQRWDRMPFHVDFRDYYGSLIDGWLGGGAVGRTRRPSDPEPRAVRSVARRDAAGARPPPSGGPAVVVPGAGGALATVGRFVALAPQRICDTRGGLGGRRGPIGPGETLGVQITGVGGVPASGVTAVAINVTSVNATEAGFFSVFPSNARCDRHVESQSGARAGGAEHGDRRRRSGRQDRDLQRRRECRLHRRRDGLRAFGIGDRADGVGAESTARHSQRCRCTSGPAARRSTSRSGRRGSRWCAGERGRGGGAQRRRVATDRARISHGLAERSRAARRVEPQLRPRPQRPEPRGLQARRRRCRQPDGERR